MRLRVLGSGDAFSGGGRLPSSYLMETAGAMFLLDCGPAILPALKRAGRSTSDFQHVVISHLHGDHFGGLPFLLIDAIYPSQRTAPLTLVGPPGLEARFRLACEVFYPRVLDTPRKFEIRFVELAAEAAQAVEGLPGVAITPYEVNHFSGSPSYALRFEMAEKVFAFSGDAGWGDNVIRAGHKADLYLLECYQYDMKLAMHLDYMTIARHFDLIDARQIVLTHMSEAMLARRDAIDASRCRAADDGMVVEF